MAFSLGIDLGTTNTVVSTARRGTDGSIEVLTESIPQIGEDGYSLENDTLLSSVLYIRDGEHNVGKIAKAMKGQNTNRVISNSKNFIGQQDYTWEIDNRIYSPEIVASYFLRAIRDFLEERYKNEDDLNTAVITVPASFNLDQKNATKVAAKLAGFTGEITLISEPTAAILDFINEQRRFDDKDKYLDFSTTKNVLVFDLGGGTCDVAILKIKIKGKEVYVEEVAVSPHTLLGGTNFDIYAVENIIMDFNKKNNKDLSHQLEKEDYKILKTKLLVTLEKAKIYFSSKYFNYKNKDIEDEDTITELIKIPIQIPNVINGEPFKFILTMKRYNEYISPLLSLNGNKENIFSPIKKTIQDSNMNKEDIEYIFCVGGMTKYPEVCNALTKYFGKEPSRYCDSMHSVSRGAAIYHHYNIKDKIEEDTDIDIIPTLPQTVFLNIKNEFPKPLIYAKTKASVPIVYEDFIEVTSEIEVILQLYTGRSYFDPDMKSLNDVILKFTHGIPIGSKISLKLEYTKAGLLEFEAWIKEHPEINIKVSLDKTQMTDNEIVDTQNKYSIKNVRGIL